MSTTARKVLPRETKEQVINAILAKQMSVQDACAKFAVQPYQVYAWIGNKTLAGSDMAPQAETPLDAIPDDLLRLIGAYWVKRLPNHLPKV